MTNREITLKKIEEEYNENCQKINELDNNIRALNGKDIGFSLTTTVAFGMFPLMGLIFLSPTLKNLGIAPELIPIINTSIASSIGAVASHSFLRHCKIKERVASFSKSKNYKEYMEERYVLQLEKSILENINEMIKKTHESISSEQSVISSLSNKYEIKEKDDSNDEPNKENYIEELESLLEEKKEKIRIATTQKFLKDTFWKSRDGYSKFGDPIIFTLMAYISSMIMIGAPLMITNNGVGTPLQALELLALPAIPSLTVLIYNIKRIKHNKYVFDKINNSLNEYSIPEKSSSDEEEIDLALAKSISEAVAVKTKLEEQKRQLDSANNSKKETITNPKEEPSIVLESPERVKKLSKTYPKNQ